jgi:hypothetical protein
LIREPLPRGALPWSKLVTALPSHPGGAAQCKAFNCFHHCNEQRSDRSYQLRTALDQLLGSHGKDIELGTADDEAEVLQKAANMVLEITLDLDQQRPARKRTRLLGAY